MYSCFRGVIRDYCVDGNMVNSRQWRRWVFSKKLFKTSPKSVPSQSTFRWSPYSITKTDLVILEKFSITWKGNCEIFLICEFCASFSILEFKAVERSNYAYLNKTFLAVSANDVRMTRKRNAQNFPADIFNYSKFYISFNKISHSSLGIRIIWRFFLNFSRNSSRFQSFHIVA